MTLRRSATSIFAFWAPLAAAWLMMALEGPLLAAIIARLPDAKFNLAAYGVAFSFAILVEAPVIMIMSASTALVEDAATFRKLRNFTFALSSIITGVMLILAVPPVFDFVARDLIGLPARVAHLTHVSLLILLPWPGAIGYRRFFQGLLIRDNKTRRVAYGTGIRLAVMASTAATLFVLGSLPGAYVGAIALASGVSIEAIASRVMAESSVRKLLYPGPAPASPVVPEPARETLDYRRIVVFYYPLALTSVIGLAVHPMVTFYMGKAPFPVESLAVLPVVNAFSFIFRAIGLSYQEVAIALLGKQLEHFRELLRFAVGLAIASSAALAVIAFTPLVTVWYQTISGLSPELAALAVTPTRIMAVLPALSVLLSFQRGMLVVGRLTRPITTATVVEVMGIGAGLALLIHGFHTAGVTAAAISFVIGRLGSNLYLVSPCLHVRRRPTL